MIKLKRYIKFILFPINHIFCTILIHIFGRRTDLKKKYYISVCAIFKNEAKFIKEWIEYNKIVGVEHFYLYNNFSTDNYKDVLSSYIDDGTVTIIEWPKEQGQVSAYVDCMSEYSHESSWIAFLDLDEYIVPINEVHIGRWLKPFEKYPAIHIYWKMFGTSGLIQADPDKLVCEQYTSCWEVNHDTKTIFNTSYSIANPNDIHSFGTNLCGHFVPGIDEKKVFRSFGLYNNVNNNTIQINHYWSKSYFDYLEKKSRGDAYFASNPRNTEYFYYHEYKNTATDYSIFKFIVKLKLALKVSK